MSLRFTPLLIGWVLGCGAICHAQKPEVRPSPTPAPSPEEKREEAVIVLERTTDYFGIAPAYTLIIYPDGRVAYIGEKNVKTERLAWGRISQQDVRRLVEGVEKAGYFSLRDRYESTDDGCPIVASDNPSVYTSVNIGGRRKSVLHYLGCSGGPSLGFAVFPQWLYELENLIDEVAGSKRWVE